MRRTWVAGPVVALALVLPLAGPAPGRAATLLGSRNVGMTNVPTADTGPWGQMTLGAVAEVSGEARSYVRYGLTADFEVGLAVGNPDPLGPPAALPLGVLMRYRIVQEQDVWPAVAVGIEGTSAYLVASHRLPGPLLRGHVGVRSFRESARVFAGVDATLNPVTVTRPGGIPEPIVTVGVDYDGLFLGVGATLRFSPWLAVGLGVQDRGALRFVAGVEIHPGF